MNFSSLFFMYLAADFDRILLALGIFHCQSLSSFWKAFCECPIAWILNKNNLPILTWISWNECKIICNNLICSVLISQEQLDKAVEYLLKAINFAKKNPR